MPSNAIKRTQLSFWLYVTCRILINHNHIINTVIQIQALKILGICQEFDSDKIIIRFCPSQEIAYRMGQIGDDFHQPANLPVIGAALVFFCLAQAG